MPSSAFDNAVVSVFGPLAQRYDLRLTKPLDGVYEIAGQDFVTRIRRGTGHRRDFLVTLSPTTLVPRGLDDLSEELGLGVIAEYKGCSLENKRISSEENWGQTLREAADASEKYLFPYLLGVQSDFDDIKRFVAQKRAHSDLLTREYSYPPDVKKKWLE